MLLERGQLMEMKIIVQIYSMLGKWSNVTSVFSDFILACD